MLDFYKSVINSVSHGVYEKCKSRIVGLETLVNTVLVTKEEVDKKIGEAKVSIKKDVDEKLVKLASVDSMLSLAQNLNKRMDNILEAVAANKPVIDTSSIQNLVEQVKQNTSDITSTASDVLDMKQILSQIVPQVMQSIDPNILGGLVEKIITDEMASLGIPVSGASDSSPSVDQAQTNTSPATDTQKRSRKKSQTSPTQ